MIIAFMRRACGSTKSGMELGMMSGLGIIETKRTRYKGFFV